MTAFAKVICPKADCTQYCERDVFDPDYVRCLWHGHVFVGTFPDLVGPGEGRRGPRHEGVRQKRQR